MRSAHVLDLRVQRVLGAMLPAAGAAFIMYAAVTAARHVLPQENSGALRMAVLIAVGALAYVAISFGLRRKGTLEVLDLVHSAAVSKRA
jgi:hypothetical protein